MRLVVDVSFNRLGQLMMMLSILVSLIMITSISAQDVKECIYASTVTSEFLVIDLNGNVVFQPDLGLAEIVGALSVSHSPLHHTTTYQHTCLLRADVVSERERERVNRSALTYTIHEGFEVIGDVLYVGAGSLSIVTMHNISDNLKVLSISLSLSSCKAALAHLSSRLVEYRHLHRVS